MKKLNFILIFILLTNFLTAFAFEEKNYINMRNELAALLHECKALGLNCDYAEKSLNIFDYNIGYIKNDIKNGASSELLAYKESCLQDIYYNTKTELERIKNENQSIDKSYGFETGDFNIDGRKLLNADGKPIFSIGTENNDPSGMVSELSHIGFNNLQIEWGPSYVIAEDNIVDSWIPNMENTEGVGAEQTQQKLHIYNDGQREFTISQTLLVKPQTEYSVTLNAWGNTEGLLVLVGDSYQEMNPSENTFTFTPDSYTTEIIIKADGETDAYIDDVTVTPNSCDKNIVINGDFSGDGFDEFDICFDAKRAEVILKTLHSSEKNNMSVNLLLSPHYFPEFLKNGIEYGPLGFYDYILDSDIAMKVLKAYIYAIMPYVTEYESLTSICLSNEPQYNTALAENIYKEEFIKYLESIHGENLTTLYGDVSSISMPQQLEATPLFYDWRNFNNKIFANWHKQLALWVKDKAPDMPVHAKIMNEIGPVRTYMQSGIDVELFDEFCDILGNDSMSFFERDVKTSFIRTLMWYDYLRSISDKPIYNSEEHLTLDGSTDLNSQLAGHFRSVLWQGAIHGRNISSIWIWNNASTGFLSGHLKMRPDCTEQTIHSLLDLNRLSEEVYAFGDKIPDAAILYSEASLVYSESYMESVYESYNSLIFAGKKVQFITDMHPEKMHSSDLLLIPEAKNVNKETLNEIKKFADAGKKIIMIGEDSLKYNEYNQANDADLVNDIKQKSVFYQSGTLSEIQNEAVKDNEYMVVDALTGEPVTDVEWQTAVSDGRVLMNLYYISDEYERAKSVSIKKGGEIINEPLELLTGEKLTDVFTLNSREPKLLDLGSTVAKDVYNLSKTENGNKACLTWNYSSQNEHKVRIYKVREDGSLSWVTDVNGTSYETDFNSPVTYMIKTQNNLGALSLGKAITIGIDSDFVLINAQKTTIDENTGSCKIYLENTLSCPVAGKIVISAKDKANGQMKKMAAFEKVLLPNTFEEFTCEVYAENSIIEITEN